jgi:2,3-bisphosphoglycerate-dependent phosphoglycerate mutase
LRGVKGLITAIVVVLMSAAAAAQQTVIFVRHAERADGGAGASNSMTGAPADPSLSEAGAARATRLAALLADAGIKGIYTSEFKRTQETARPLAAKLGLAIEVVPSKDAAGLAAKVKAAHARATVLVIGHSNTIPDLIRAFGGPEVKIADDEYSGIYILTPSAATLTLIRY